MALKLIALMPHSVALTLSTRRMNLDVSSHSFSHSFALFTALDRQETRQENTNRVSLSKTQLNSGSYWISHTTVVSPAATSLTLSLACFAQRNSLAVNLLSG